MAELPTPRSYAQILGDMMAAFLSKTGLTNLKAGDPPLTIFEAASQSDVRSSQDLFQMLAAISLGTAEGTALDRIAVSEKTRRITEFAASGPVRISDTSFTKISTKIYQGAPAPIVGAGTVYVQDASGFPATGSIYLGRGTVNYEGPLVYTAKTNLGTYWSITLHASSKTQKFHNQGESAILAQGGNRQISSGQIVQIPAGSSAQSVQFSVLYTAYIPDGETQVDKVPVLASKPGVSGNAPAGAINSFSSVPFAGATVTNIVPFTNALPTEDDKTLRERIANLRQSRSLGTDLAIEMAVLGATSSDENKRITGAVVVANHGAPTTLFIDDGTGYEEQSLGVATETLMDSASGGEQFFQTTRRPIAKAFLVTTISAPFTLFSGAKLAVETGGVLQEHTFNDTDFRSIDNADAFEVVSSINANSDLLFSARTLGSGSQVVIEAKADSQESVEVVAASTNDANDYLGFPSGRSDTVWLYKNDKPLSKDGVEAQILSESQSNWATMTSPLTLVMSVDGTPSNVFTFTDDDFVNANTGFATVSEANSLESWAAVLNAKIPGITASVVADRLLLTSNLGRTSRASLEITDGTLALAGKMFIFTAASSILSEGRERDYTVNRNTSQLKLEVALAAGDKLTVGSTKTRAFVQTPALTVFDLVSTASLWFVVDGGAQIISTGVSSTTVVTLAEYVTSPANSWGRRMRTTASSGSPFSNVAVGDWAIFMDTSFSAGNRKALRVATVDPSGAWFDTERYLSASGQAGLTMNNGGIVFVRTMSQIQKIDIASGSSYTAATLTDAINQSLIGASAEVYKTNRVRIHTDSFGVSGDIALVAQNTEAEVFGLNTGSAISNDKNHLASIQSAGTEIGTPNFNTSNGASIYTINGTPGTLSFNVTGSTPETYLSGRTILKFLRANPEADGANFLPRISSNFDRNVLTADAGAALGLTTVRLASVDDWLPADRIVPSSLFAISPEDSLNVLVDNDTNQHNYSIDLRRNGKPGSSTYGTSNVFTDTENGSGSLALAFGVDFNWQDFAVYMHARCKSHAESGNTTKTILWRYPKFGPDGTRARIKYTYPKTASTPTSVFAESLPYAAESRHNIFIQLPTGPARTGPTFRSTSRVGIIGVLSGSIYTTTFITGFTFSASRTTNVVTANLSVGTSGASDHGFQTGDKIWVNGNGVLGSGVKTITRVSNVQVTWSDTGANVGYTIDVGTVSADISGELLISTSDVVPGDVFYAGTDSGLNIDYSLYQLPMRIATVGGQFWTGYTNSVTVEDTVVTWWPLQNTASLSFYPVDVANCKASDIATAVNALAALPESACPVTAVAVGLVGDASGEISQASHDEFATAFYRYDMVDGLNFVKTHSTPGTPSTNFTFTFRNAVDSSLATNSDWENEQVRFVPQTTQNICDFLGILGVSGLGSAAYVLPMDNRKIQISSKTIGSTGSVQVLGGLANSLSATVFGAAQNRNSVMSVETNTADVKGVVKDMWVEIQNSFPMPKAVFGSTTSCTSIDTAGNLVLNTTKAWDWANTATGAIDGYHWCVERVGKYTLFSWAGIGSAPTLTGISEGDWVVVSGGNLNSRNTGQFRIVRCHVAGRNFWIENPNGISQQFGDDNLAITANLKFLKYNSVMPGDSLLINTEVWGTGNQGTWTIASLDYGSGGYGFRVSGITEAFTGPTALSTEYPLVQCYESEAGKLLKQIIGIAVSETDVTRSFVKFYTSAGYANVGASAGSLLVACDKLEFPTISQNGVDGYKYSTGLIGEANRLIYGDKRDPATYPGVVASGTNVNTSGPVVKRVQIGLAVRIRSGFSNAEVVLRVKSAVASVVNKSAIGKAVAISDVVKAAAGVQGVSAVTILSPTYGAGEDLIPVQPQEKLLVLDINTDIQVSLVGE